MWLRRGALTTGLPHWTRRPAVSVAAAAGIAVLVRVPRVGALAYPDEGGALLVVRQWHTGGPGLYGTLEVDRPPLLMAFWRAADALGGVEPARWLVCPLVAVLVLAAGWAGWLIGGAKATRWSAITVAALAATPLLGTWEVNAELVGVPFIMVSCAVTLLSLDQARHRNGYRPWALLAGLVGSSAVLVKQNLADALVFAAVLLAVSAVREALPRADVVRLAGWLAAGAALPLVAAAAWATVWGPGVGALWDTLYGFRSEAFQVVMTQSITYPSERLQLLGLLATSSGLLVLAGVYLGFQSRPRRRAEPLSIAVAAMMVFGLLSVGLGASYWGHYLIELVPALGLAAGHLSLAPPSTRRWAALTVSFVAASAVTANAVAATGALVPSRAPDQAVVTWLSSAAERSDSVVVAYGHPDLIAESGLTPGYRYLWSLTMRTRDPQLTELTEVIGDRNGPTWLVAWLDLNSWSIDEHGRLSDLVARRYQPVATLCGVQVYLRVGVDRALPPTTAACGE